MSKETFLEDSEQMFSQLDRLRSDVPHNADEIVSILHKLTQQLKNYQGTHKYGTEFDARVLETDREELLNIVKYAETHPAADRVLKQWVSDFDPHFTDSYGTMNGGGTLPSAEIMLRENDEITAEFVENVSKFARITGTNICIFNILGGPVNNSNYDSDASLLLVVGGTDFSRGVVIPNFSLILVKYQTVEGFDSIALPLDWALEEIPKNDLI